MIGELQLPLFQARKILEIESEQGGRRAKVMCAFPLQDFNRFILPLCLHPAFFQSASLASSPSAFYLARSLALSYHDRPFASFFLVLLLAMSYHDRLFAPFFLAL